jgi:hypothetical protein
LFLSLNADRAPRLRQSFIEEETVPTDAELIGQTWKKANKDGSPDRRFANNYQIPIVNYGDFRLRSPSGLNEAYMISNERLARGFAEAFLNYQRALPAANAQQLVGPERR